MKINSLELTNFRNLKHISLSLGHKANIFYGHNGSGKTSFLEAIYYLSLGRSFRTRHLNRIMHHEASTFSIYSQLTENNTSTVLPIGIERQRDNTQFTLRIAGQPATSLVEVAKILPLQFINADSHFLLTAGPLIRRQFLDWGVFHVEHSFFHYWQRANRIIKQRNANLKEAKSYQEINVWDEELINCSQHLNCFRRRYLEQFQPILQRMLEQLLERQDITLTYYPGWNEKQELGDILQHNFNRDRQVGYTQQGPHRADLQLKIKGIAAQDILSQGQQKLAAYALRFSQGKLFFSHSDKHCLFLIDDLPSELDAEKRQLIANIIKELPAQLFITCIEIESLVDLLTLPDIRRFHVEHGEIAPAK